MNRKAWFQDILKKYDRVAICGVVNGGKTTLSRLVRDRPVIHTDSFMNVTWEDAPNKIFEMVVRSIEHDDKKFVVEGIQVPRTLRKGLEVDVVLWLNVPLEENSTRQNGMSKGSKTVLDEWREKNPKVPVLIAPPIEKIDEDE